MKNVEVTVYLDTDRNGDDLLDSAGNPITAGWYIFAFPLGSEPLDGPFDSEKEAIGTILFS